MMDKEFLDGLEKLLLKLQEKDCALVPFGKVRCIESFFNEQRKRSQT